MYRTDGLISLFTYVIKDIVIVFKSFDNPETLLYL
jgi:hypothetical protein